MFAMNSEWWRAWACIWVSSVRCTNHDPSATKLVLHPSLLLPSYIPSNIRCVGTKSKCTSGRGTVSEIWVSNSCNTRCDCCTLFTLLKKNVGFNSHCIPLTIPAVHFSNFIGLKVFGGSNGHYNNELFYFIWLILSALFGRIFTSRWHCASWAQRIEWCSRYSTARSVWSLTCGNRGGGRPHFRKHAK